MRHYSFTDQLYKSELETHNADVTAVSQTISLRAASKTLFLRNDGTDDIFIAFDKAVATTGDFKLTSADGLVPIDVQCTQLSVVCAADKTSSIRIGSNY